MMRVFCADEVLELLRLLHGVDLKKRGAPPPETKASYFIFTATRIMARHANLPNQDT